MNVRAMGLKSKTRTPAGGAMARPDGYIVLAVVRRRRATPQCAAWNIASPAAVGLPVRS